MPSSLSHAAAGLALATAFRPNAPPTRFWLLAGACAVFSDRSSPFSSHRFHFSLIPIGAIGPASGRTAAGMALAVGLNELAWIWLPSIAFVGIVEYLRTSLGDRWHDARARLRRGRP